jgi:protein-tyrosine-phosphatase
MREVGLDISGHVSRPLTIGELDRADLVFVMEEKHRRSIVDLLPDAGDRVRLIAEGGVPDPAGKGLDEYRRARDALARRTRELTRRLP